MAGAKPVETDGDAVVGAKIENPNFLDLAVILPTVEEWSILYRNFSIEASDKRNFPVAGAKDFLKRTACQEE